jgi:hypothetical protein
MFTLADLFLIELCLEGFFFGKIFVLCALNCTLAKEVRLFLHQKKGELYTYRSKSRTYRQNTMYFPE